MRNKFADTVYEIGLINQNISLVVADISPAGSIEKFRQKLFRTSPLFSYKVISYEPILNRCN